MAPLGPSWRRELDAIRSTRSLVPLLMTDAAALQIQICVRAALSLDGAMAEAGVLMGVPVRVEQVEELLRSLAQPRIAQTDPEEDEEGTE